MLKKTESETSIKASDEVTKLITEKKKPFTDVKETNIFKYCLSSRTITKCSEEFSKDAKSSQINQLNNL